jgi:proteasome lid subunit RPN8/RPN11
VTVDQEHLVPGLTTRLREQIYEHVFVNDGGEVGGVLVGRARPGKVAVVHGAIPALEAQGERASVTFTHEAWSKVHAVMEKDYPDMTIVGWYHSHPGFGIFLSGHDLFIHKHFFSEESSVAYVIDPHAGEEGLFGWREGEIEQFYKGATTWRPTRPGGLESARHQVEARDRSSNGAASVPPPLRMAPIVLVMVVGFLIGLGVTLVVREGGGSPAKAPSPAPTLGRQPERDGSPPGPRVAPGPTAVEPEAGQPAGAPQPTPAPESERPTPDPMRTGN